MTKKTTKGKVKNFHTPSSHMPNGYNQGTGIRNPVGIDRSLLIGGKLSKKKLSKPPKSLA